jgi:hypothetical protein
MRHDYGDDDDNDDYDDDDDGNLQGYSDTLWFVVLRIFQVCAIPPSQPRSLYSHGPSTLVDLS